MPTPDDDLKKTAEELLGDLRSLSSGSASPTNPAYNTKLGLEAIRKFACLPTVLGQQSDRQTKRIVTLTWGLFWLTLFLAVIASVQIASMIMQYFGSAR